MPIIGAVTGGLDFSNYYTQLTGPKVAAGTPLAEAKKSGAVLAWGNFLTIVINFVIIAWVLFISCAGSTGSSARRPRSRQRLRNRPVRKSCCRTSATCWRRRLSFLFGQGPSRNRFPLFSGSGPDSSRKSIDAPRLFDETRGALRLYGFPAKPSRSTG